MSYRSYRKYLDDYRIEEQITETGRRRKVTVYVAGYYTLVPAISRRDKWLILIATALEWSLILGGLSFKGQANEKWYVLLPFVFTIMPLYYLTRGAISLFLAGERLERQKADRIARFLPVPSLAASVLPLISCIGIIIIAITQPSIMISEDKLFGVLSLLAALASAFTYSKCRKLTTFLL